MGSWDLEADSGRLAEARFRHSGNADALPQPCADCLRPSCVVSTLFESP